MKLERSDATVAGVEEPCGRAFAPSFLPSVGPRSFFKRRASAACYAPCPPGQWEGDVQYPFLATSAPRKNDFGGSARPLPERGSHCSTNPAC